MNKRTTFAVLMIFILCFQALFGCDTVDSEQKRFKRLEALLSPSDPVEITIWHYYSGNIESNFNSLVSEFNASLGAEKGIGVKTISKNSADSLYNSILDSSNQVIGADPLPDIFQAYTDTVFALGSISQVATLDKYFRAQELDEYVDSYLAEGRFGAENELKILPIAKSTEALVVNKKAWEAFVAAENNAIGLEDLATIEGIKAVSQRFYDRYGKAFFGRDTFSNYIIVGLKQLGYDVFLENEGIFEINEQKQAYKKLWDNMYEPVLKGLYTCGSGFRTDEMQNEKVIAYIGSTASAGYIPAEVKEVQGEKVTGQERYDNEVMILPLPIFAQGAKVSAQQGAGLAVVASNEKREYASALFLKWFTENERNLQFATQTSYSPVKKAVSGFDAISRSNAYNSPSTKENVKKMLEVTCNMNNDFSFYFTKGFKNGATIRNSFLTTKNFETSAPYKQSLEYWCVTDAARVKNDPSLISSLLSEENFEQWYQNYIAAIKLKINE